MIARIWHGAVPVRKSDAYLEKMRAVALPGYRDVEGNQGAWVMHRVEGHTAHFDMLTFWDDVDAIDHQWRVPVVDGFFDDGGREGCISYADSSVLGLDLAGEPLVETK